MEDLAYTGPVLHGSDYFFGVGCLLSLVSPMTQVCEQTSHTLVHLFLGAEPLSTIIRYGLVFRSIHVSE